MLWKFEVMSIENFSLKIFEYKNETCIRAEIVSSWQLDGFFDKSSLERQLLNNNLEWQFLENDNFFLYIYSRIFSFIWTFAQ